MADGDRPLSLDPDPWATVLAEIAALVRRRFWPLANNPAYEAADLVQDVAVQAWRWARDVGRGERPSPALLATIVDRALVDALRHHGPRSRRGVRRRRLPLPDDPPGLRHGMFHGMPGVAEHGDVAEAATARLMAADRLHRLPARTRAVLGALGAGYRQTEVAALLGVSASRVSQIAAAARARAREGKRGVTR